MSNLDISKSYNKDRDKFLIKKINDIDFDYNNVINKLDEYILELNNYKDIDKLLVIDKSLVCDESNESVVFKTELVEDREYEYLC